MSSFFYGYITTQLLGGILASRFGGRKVFGIGVGVTALFTLITPWVATVNVYLLLVVRIIEGIFEVSSNISSLPVNNLCLYFRE